MKLTSRGKAMILGGFAIVICLAAVNNQLQTEKDTVASTEYVNYEEQQLNEHNGDVLVDSLNLTAVPGKSEEEVDSQVVTSDDYAEISNADSFFNEARATLNMDRDNIIGMLTEVIAETKDGQEKNNATNQKLRIIDYMNKEKSIESLVKAKGYTDALVVITDSAVTVTINKKDLSQSDVAKICDIVIRETGRNANQIVIQSKV